MAMGSEYWRRPTKRLEREFRGLGGAPQKRGSHGITYAFPDGAVHVIPPGVTPGKAREILQKVQARYGTKPDRTNADPLRSAVDRDGAPIIDVDRLSMSKHATARFELMTRQARLAAGEVADALRFPERVVWSPIHESWMWVRGRIIVAAIVDETEQTLIRTILWATEDLWEQNPRPGKENP